MDLAYEEILSSLFSGNVATGRLARSAAMDNELSPEPVPEPETDAVDVDLEGLGGWEFFRTFVETVTDDRASSHSGVGADINDDPVQPTQTPLPTPKARIANEKQTVKRKRRQSDGSFRFEEHLTHTRANNDKMVALFQEEVNSKDKVMEDKVKSGLDHHSSDGPTGYISEGNPTVVFFYILEQIEEAHEHLP